MKFVVKIEDRSEPYETSTENEEALPARGARRFERKVRILQRFFKGINCFRLYTRRFVAQVRGKYSFSHSRG